MSKKETRRAVRQAFPKAKTPPPKRAPYGTRQRRPVPSRARSTGRPALRPPTIRRAVIQGAIVAVLYFVVIQWAWQSGTSTAMNLLFSLGGFVIYSGVAYAVDRWRYQRALRKSQSSR